MTPDVVVLDASALIDAAAQPARNRALQHIQETHALVAPFLLASEAGHVVHCKRPRSFGATPTARAEVLETMLEGIDLIAPDAASRHRAALLAARHKLTFYDAEYLELAARRAGALLLTQDQALLAAARRRLGTARAFDLAGASDAIEAGSL